MQADRYNYITELFDVVDISTGFNILRPDILERIAVLAAEDQKRIPVNEKQKKETAYGEAAPCD